MSSSPISIEITPVKSLKSTHLPTQKYISRSIYLHHRVNAMRLISLQLRERWHFQLLSMYPWGIVDFSYESKSDQSTRGVCEWSGSVISMLCEGSFSAAWVLCECFVKGLWLLLGALRGNCECSVSAWWMLCEGRRCKPFDEINVMCSMYLDLSVTKRCSFWRHGFRKQAMLSRWK